MTHQSWPGVRRRRDSQPSIHLPRDVYLPGMNTAASAFSRFDFDAKKSSLVAIARPPIRAQARSTSAVNPGGETALLIFSAMLRHTAYGKSQVRLVQVKRNGNRDDLRDLAVSIRFEGDYDASYAEGDNRDVLPTDTMKNTVYALAAQQPVKDPESFALRLCLHFLEGNPRLQRATVDLVEHHWHRIDIGEREHGQAFIRRGPDTRLATVIAGRHQATVTSGIDGLLIMKTADSAFANFRRDEWTTLPETRDRLLATSLTATWTYGDPDIPFEPAWRAVRQQLLTCFAEHQSESVQHTLYAMGQAVLDEIAAVMSITLVMPNRHHLPVDLGRLGLENHNEIFVATDEPYGLIEATLTR